MSLKYEPSSETDYEDEVVRGGQGGGVGGSLGVYDAAVRALTLRPAVEQTRRV